MRRIERYHLIQEISGKLQEEMNTVSINSFLGNFGIQTENVWTVASKRVYVDGLLTGQASDSQIIEIAQALDIEVSISHSTSVLTLQNLLERSGLQACQDDFDRAIQNIDTDPDQALASGCSTLESVCKAILDKMGSECPKDQSIQPLLRKVFEVMELSPEGHADAEIKRILGGLFNAGVGVGTIRTKYSAAHGRRDGQRKLQGRHARLAINSAATVGLFLLETYQERFASQEL